MSLVAATILTIDEGLLMPDYESNNAVNATEGTVNSATATDIVTDVLIIGAGLAGITTALALPKTLKITVLSKAGLEECSSHYAQGGIAASLDKDDSVNDHIADTLIAGAGLCAPDNTSRILTKGQQAVQWLCSQGVPFTQTALAAQKQNYSSTDSLTDSPTDSPADSATDSLNDGSNQSNGTTQLTTADLHLTKEGGHGCRRVAHADDATGLHTMQALLAKAQLATNITILPYHEALQLLTSSASTPVAPSTAVKSPNAITAIQIQPQRQLLRQCQGALVFDHTKQQQLTITSRAVVIASGGLGQLFARASAPNVCVGDGVMMAWQAGCRLANLEFIQFHPTGLALADSSFLVSEALRGEGGHLYCPLTAERFMVAIDPRAELAPRDIVARAIAAQIATNGLGFVHLDVSHLPALFLTQHFPQIYQTLLALGIDLTTDPIPVAPTAHYSCGGIVTCSDGLTDVMGLYAAGEVAYTGLHGANRLASNSLLECVVVGRNIAAHLPTYLSAPQWTAPLIDNDKLISLSGCLVLDKQESNKQLSDKQSLSKNKSLSAKNGKLQQQATNQQSSKQQSSEQQIIKKISTENYSTQSIELATISIELKALMSSHLGITRNAQSLQQALIQISHWQQQLAAMKRIKSLLLDIECLTVSNSSVTLNELTQFQLARQLQLASLIIQSAYQRCESRGGHYRLDYPTLANQATVSVIEPEAAEVNYAQRYQAYAMAESG
ncbi:L-aspartate oxidase [Psychrobacter sp. TAE2020]|uniref:L-aspartate oxidase n=1 Tax=Psychrobacter sp. TAE2020 TaxID=2846762 RepID=UPI001E4C8493|nr:FAD-dependent oxidoreductase [Psychrobacter sp. TAE2020]